MLRQHSAAIEAHNLVKRYRLNEHYSLRLTLDLLRGRHEAPDMLNALDDVSFAAERGECLGVVGGNGSGKSTLFQLIGGITLPTAGSMRVEGTVLPLLAVGTGFHPELTGRENVELFGSILGLPLEVIEERMDEIVAFAELERHMDTPNKRYSSGMQARLSFAVATQFPADIYLFDEVLAVVDGEFRTRCLAEIRRLADDGGTVLFVSHDLDQVSELCDRAMWMQTGRLRAMGPAGEVLSDYESGAA
jgi:ABC-type polysaccharide/polyol phosphate transport system ATPase subunit